MGSVETEPYVKPEGDWLNAYDKSGWRIRITSCLPLKKFSVEEWAQILQDTANEFLDEVERQQNPTTPRLKLTNET